MERFSSGLGSGDESQIGESASASASASEGRGGEVEAGEGEGEEEAGMCLEMPDVSASIMVESSSGRGEPEGRWMEAWGGIRDCVV